MSIIIFNFLKINPKNLDEKFRLGVDGKTPAALNTWSAPKALRPSRTISCREMNCLRAYIYKNREKGKTSTRDGRIFSTLDRLISAILSPTASVMIPPHALKLDSMVSVTKGSM